MTDEMSSSFRLKVEPWFSVSPWLIHPFTQTTLGHTLCTAGYKVLAWEAGRG